MHFFSPRDMDEYEDSQSPAPSYQYPKETLRKRQNSVQNSGGSVSSRFSRKSFKLDYRLEEDVTKSKKGKDGRFVNPWPTWKNISIPNVLRWLIMEKNHSGVPGSKEELDKELPVLKPYFVSDPEDAGVREAGHDKVTFVFTPSQHWCKRTLLDDNKVLWGSWSVLGPWSRFFFAGDTGYCPAFEEIGKRFGPFDLAAIPIGAYEPRWFMKYQHADPEDAVRIHIDLQTKRSVAIHWGTFALANEHYLEPPVKLNEALERYGLSCEDFFILKHGESRYLNTDDRAFEET